ncbi:DUF1178 family protein [Sulfitobacter sabulilitoris]|uniref:DUF1178 family protein n=1 Tax=Sulfitobacter sabulilitoris TaxID=2562655 RepID=A0A5S3PRK9_9RHOB|nr:DUF1178 family protein [Sulfitobacter sabulilitoris]TMM55195.1 DUF1178 family protein [Sulfitobacter sabulilitoris]
MIHYALKCKEGHSFESWFQSAAAYDALSGAGHVACVECGSTQVSKAVMAPRVAAARPHADGARAAPRAAEPDRQGTAQADGPLRGKPDARQKALAALRRQVEANSDYVGGDFAREARAMHLGTAPERPIYGEANLAEAKALVEEGIPVAPLPFLPNRKAN